MMLFDDGDPGEVQRTHCSPGKHRAARLLAQCSLPLLRWFLHAGFCGQGFVGVLRKKHCYILLMLKVWTRVGRLQQRQPHEGFDILSESRFGQSDLKLIRISVA